MRRRVAGRIAASARMVSLISDLEPEDLTP